MSEYRTTHLDHGQKFKRSRGKNVVASFWRGGTSKGVFISSMALPNNLFPHRLLHGSSRNKIRWEEHTDRLQLFLNGIFGSPDHYGRQLNGLGGGISSLSKAVLYHRPINDKDADVEYTFIQVGVEDGKLDMTGNCGNLSSVIGPLALNEREFVPSPDRFDHSKAVQLVDDTLGRDPESRKLGVPVTVRLRNTNTAKLIHATFMTTFPMNSASDTWHYQPSGRYAIDGVPGTGAEVDVNNIPKWVELGRTARCLMEGFVNTSTDHMHDLEELPFENKMALTT